MRGNAFDLPQRAVRFDQHVQRDALPARGIGVDAARHRFDGCQAAHLRERHIGHASAGGRQDGLEVLLPVRVADVVDADADAAEPVGGRRDHRGDHLGVLALAPDRCAVFAVGGDVENRADLRLVGQRLEQEALVAGVVVAHRQHERLRVAAKERMLWLQRCRGSRRDHRQRAGRLRRGLVHRAGAPSPAGA